MASNLQSVWTPLETVWTIGVALFDALFDEARRALVDPLTASSSSSS